MLAAYMQGSLVMLGGFGWIYTASAFLDGPEQTEGWKVPPKQDELRIRRLSNLSRGNLDSWKCSGEKRKALILALANYSLQDQISFARDVDPKYGPLHPRSKLQGYRGE